MKNSLRYYRFYDCIRKAHPGEYDEYMVPRIRFHTREMLEECLYQCNVRITAHRFWLYLKHHLPLSIDWEFSFSVANKIVGFAISNIRISLGRLLKSVAMETLVKEVEVVSGIKLSKVSFQNFISFDAILVGYFG